MKAKQMVALHASLSITPQNSMDLRKHIHNIVTYLIATVWLVNGLLCKVLNLVPRHQQIVGRILGNDHSFLLTKVIGVSEIMMAIWIVTRIKAKVSAITQIVIIATMNTLEFLLVPDLLLWGKLNPLFAFLFIVVIYFNEFLLNKTRSSTNVTCFHS